MSVRRKYDRSSKPPCPQCESDRSLVIDSGPDRIPAPPDVFPRRRRCSDCGARWYTYEHNYREEKHNIWVGGET